MFRDILTALFTYYGITFFVTIFEQLYAIFFAYSLLLIFKEWQNIESTKIWKKLIEAAYATYIIHQWVIIPLAVGFAYTDIAPILIIFILMIIAPPISWIFGILLKMIPKSEIFI
jgi:hypothetical protein